MNADTLSLSSQALDMRMASALGLLSPLRAQWCSGDHQQRLGLSSEHAVAVVKKIHADGGRATVVKAAVDEDGANSLFNRHSRLLR
jgi:hypothetical protein